ncbi:tyrosine--tRNA ligase [Ahrensia sp. R2A130]|uniref:tyrosine--tRNA ligase n=1 Tax=Ahrensia sp. R2A130 TaxID=744979 RepID=UPI0001E0AC5B|nr:tyrosine--tRNA ligase [Ahrensia sp. R2A130]EFL90119.1 tyrosyl-tRNA synthetase [Ahrensia sp. R2A130]
MSRFKSDFLATLDERGFIHQISDETGLDDLLTKEVVTAYIGFDATAKSLHVGSMTQIMLLHWFQQTGHRPVALMGGGTTMVGDPSGKDESRQMMTAEIIADNKTSIQKCFDPFLTFGDGKNDAIMADNADWLLDLNYVEFLRDYGKHLSVNAMLARDSVKTRLDREQHLSFLEFNYMCLQAYDYVELSRRYDCRLQIGGSDQWGNILSGVDLGRRSGTPQLYALTSPLLTTSSGAKMGKSASGAVWMNEDMLPVFDFWQYWRNTEDADVPRFLKLFTTLPMDEIARLSALEGNELNDAKKVLATETTAMVHGRDAAEKAAETARQTFEQGTVSADLPTISVPAGDFEAGTGILGLLVTAGLAGSNGEARRHIKGGAVKVNDQAVSDERMMLDKSFLTDGAVKLSFGKKRHVLIRPE